MRRELLALFAMTWVGCGAASDHERVAEERDAGANGCLPITEDAFRVHASVAMARAGVPGDEAGRETEEVIFVAERRHGHVALRLDEVAEGGALAARTAATLGSIVVLDVAQDCGIDRVGFVGEAPDAFRILGRAIGQAVSVPLADRPAWDAELTDAFGTYRAHFVEESRTVTLRRRLEYVRVFGAPHVRVPHARGDARYVWSRTGWLESADIEDAVTIDLLGTAVELGMHLELARREGASGFEVPGDEALSWEDIRDAPPTVVPFEQAPLGLRGPRTSELLAPEHATSLVALALQLGDRGRSDSGTVEEIADALQAAPSLPVDALSALFLALSRAGTPRAQEILCDHAAAPDAELGIRLHAIVALHGVAQPTDSAVTTLATIARGHLDAPTGRAAFMAIATWAGRTDPGALVAGAQPLMDELLDVALESEAALGLAAIGNHGGARYESIVAARLEDSRAPVRSAAVDATARWTPADVSRVLSPRVQSEADPDVLANVLSRLAVVLDRGADADPATLEAVRAHLDDRDVDVRASAIDVLGTRSDDATVRRALVTRFALEPDAAVRRRIGRYVEARELAGVVDMDGHDHPRAPPMLTAPVGPTDSRGP